MIHESFRTYSMNYLRNLDDLRFLAVFSVMIAHWIKNDPIDHPLGYGVFLFFALSGFHITRFCFRTKLT